MSFVMTFIVGMAGYSLAGGLIWAAGRMLYVKSRRITPDMARELTLLLFVAFCAGLASQTILPSWSAGIDSETGRPYFDVFLGRGARNVNLIPFRTILHQLRGYRGAAMNDSDRAGAAVLNLLGNTLVFAPLGFFPPVLWKRFRDWLSTFLLGLGVCVFIEIVQYFIARSPDIDDVILNVLGVMLGYGIYRLTHRRRRYKKRRPYRW